MIAGSYTTGGEGPRQRLRGTLGLAFLLVASLLVASLAHGAERAPHAPVVSVLGTGTVSAPPDRALFRIGASIARPAATAALNESSAIVQRVRGILVEAGIDGRHIQTVQFSLSPQFAPRQRGGEQPSVVGYQAVHVLRVRTEKLNGLGTLLDALVSSGANVLDSIQFTLADPAPLLDRARKLAIADAKRKADVLAEAAGMKLGTVAVIREGTGPNAHPRSRGGGMEMATIASVPVVAGENELQATVVVEYTLLP